MGFPDPFEEQLTAAEAVAGLADSLTLHAVTTATADDDLADVYFEATPRELVLMGGAGLYARPSYRDPRHRTHAALVAVYDNAADAIRHAELLIQLAQNAAVPHE